MEKTPNDYNIIKYYADHLHLRGENPTKTEKVTFKRGSPPLTWRKLSKQKEYQMVCQDHLHLRGENQPNKSNDSMSAGSPPLTWRKPKGWAIGQSVTRITSTYVEKTGLIS